MFNIKNGEKRLFKRVYFKINNVCNRRQLLLEKIKKYLYVNNVCVVYDVTESDAVFYFSCAFNEFNEVNGLQILKNFIDNVGNKIFVIGCLSSVAKNKILKLGVSEQKILTFDDINKLDYLLFNNKCISINNIPEQNYFYKRKNTFSIMVSYGCDSNCSYCGDKKVVGSIRSKSLHDVLKEINGAVAKGCKNINLIGDDVGAYGVDQGTSIVELLNLIISNFNKDIETLNLFELNLKYVKKYFKDFEKIFDSKKIKNLVVAFQSGSDRILKIMNRDYSKKDILKVLELLDKYKINYHLHAIVGFPTETDEDFAETIDILKKFNFSSCSMFRYQDRNYVSSTKIFPKIEKQIVNNRIAKVEKMLETTYYSIHKEDKVIFRRRFKLLSKKQCVVVLAMHRSGTSAITGLLNKMGVYLGEELLEANEGNPKGYFENKKLLFFNDSLLNSLGTCFEDIEFDYRWIIESDDYDKYVNDLCGIIDNEFDGVDLFAIKDPRLCLLFPIYEEALKRLGLNIKIIRMIRDPLEVAVSLKAVGDFDYNKSLALWINYNLLAEYFIGDKYQKINVVYSNLLYDFDNNFNKISNLLGIQFDKNKKELSSFLDENLYRSRKKDDVIVEKNLLSLGMEIYEKLIKNSIEKDIVKNYLSQYRSIINSEKFFLIEKSYYKRKYSQLNQYNSHLINQNKYLTNENKYIKLKLENIEKLTYYERISIFGLGKSGKMTYEFISKYFPEKIKYFIDDNVKGEFNGIPIVTTNEFLENHQNEVDVVLFGRYQHLNPKLVSNIKIKYLRLDNII